MVPGVGLEREGDSKTYGATSINVDATGNLFLSRVLRVKKPLIAKWLFAVRPSGVKQEGK